jgi:hypothetical protein
VKIGSGVDVDANGVISVPTPTVQNTKLKIQFSSDFIGQTYTITGDTTTHTGAVPAEMVVSQDIANLNTLYTISCDDSLGTTFSTQVYVGSYYGEYPVELSTFSATLKITTDAGAIVTASSTDRTYTGIAGADKTITFNIGASGTYTINATLNGESASPATVSIINEVQYTANVPVFPNVPWSTGTDEEIAQMISLAHKGKLDLQQDAGWQVGDVRTITVSQFTMYGSTTTPEQQIDIAISSFDDYESCGCVMQFDFKDQLSTGCGMNSGSTNVGGYGASRMFSETLPALVEALPYWLNGLLLTFNCKGYAGGGSSTIETITGNKLALRSGIEIFGSTSVGEGSQIQYYTTTENRIKKRGHTGSASQWWNRTPADNFAFGYVQANGTSNSTSANAGFGVAPFGCI